MNNTIQIVSDGTARGTKVLGPGGEPIQGVTSIELDPILPNGLVTARVTVFAVKLDLTLPSEQAVVQAEGISRFDPPALDDPACGEG